MMAELICRVKDVENVEVVENVESPRPQLFSQQSQQFKKPGRRADQPSRTLDPDLIGRNLSRNSKLTAHKERKDHGDQTGALDEGGHQDHVGTDITQGFRLTCDAFHRFATDVADADTNTNYCQTGANCCVHN